MRAIVASDRAPPLACPCIANSFSGAFSFLFFVLHSAARPVGNYTVWFGTRAWRTQGRSSRMAKVDHHSPTILHSYVRSRQIIFRLPFRCKSGQASVARQ